MSRKPGYQPGEWPASYRTGDSSKPSLWRGLRKNASVSVFRQNKNEPGDANDKTCEQTRWTCHSTFTEKKAWDQGQHQRGKHLEIGRVGISPGQNRYHIGEENADKTQETPNDHCGQIAPPWSCRQCCCGLSRCYRGKRHVGRILVCLLRSPLFSLNRTGFLVGPRQLLCFSEVRLLLLGSATSFFLSLPYPLL